MQAHLLEMTKFGLKQEKCSEHESYITPVIVIVAWVIREFFIKYNFDFNVNE
jgi:hypothetical protein